MTSKDEMNNAIAHPVEYQDREHLKRVAEDIQDGKYGRDVAANLLVMIAHFWRQRFEVSWPEYAGCWVEASRNQLSKRTYAALAKEWPLLGKQYIQSGHSDYSPDGVADRFLGI